MLAKRLCGLLWAYFAIGFLAPIALAQSRDESSRFDPRESIKRMDANHDGRIDQREIPMYMRKYVERAAQESGLNMNEPMAVDALGEAMSKHSSERRSREGDRGRSEGDRGRSEGDRGRSEGERSRSEGDRTRSESGGTREGGASSSSSSGGSSSPSSLVPGFGQDPKLAKPPGFDVKPNYATSERSASSGGSASGFGSSGSSASSDRGKMRRYAESLMKQYDANNNGVLEKNEWDKMSGSPKKADGNNDDTLTLEELTDHVARLSGAEPSTTAVASNTGGGSGGSGNSPSGGGSSWRDRERGDDRGRSSSNGGSDTKLATRALTPTERLPKGLPDWFIRNDADGDGQIAMFEFTTAWSYDKAGEFVKYDRDGDGFVTPAECLMAEKEKKR